MPSHRSRILAVAPLTAGVVALAAFAMPASAATVVTSPCVVYFDAATSSMAIAGNGFTPGPAGVVNLLTNSAANPTPQLLVSTTPDAIGGFSGTTEPPEFNSSSTKEQTFNLFAQDNNPAIPPAVTQFKQIRFGGTVSPRSGRPSRKVRYRVRGFTPGRNVYVHFRFNGRTRKNVKISRATSPCGKATRKMSLLPTKVRYGTWKIYIDQKSTYSADTLPRLESSLTISRTFGKSAGGPIVTQSAFRAGPGTPPQVQLAP